MLFKINLTLKDLLQPGLPTINKGILLFMQTNKENKFSNNDLFFAIPSGIDILFAIYHIILLSKVNSKNIPKLIRLY